MPRIVSRKEAALELGGISRQRLEKLIKAGRITEVEPGQINIEKAKKQYEATLDPVRLAAWRGHVAMTGAPARPDPAPAPTHATAPRPSEIAVTPAEPPADGDTSPASMSDFNRAKARRAVTDADMAELKYKEAAGLLLRRDEVESWEHAMASMVRERIHGFPARLESYLPPEAMRVITEDCDALVRELHEAAQRMCGDVSTAESS